MITGHTRFIAHLGVPTQTFRSPMIYNPWFEQQGIDTIVVPMGCEIEDFPAFLGLVLRQRNCVGALITMPHKITAAGLVDVASPAVRLCGACNAVKRDGDGRLYGDMFDGAGFVAGVIRNGRQPQGASAFIAGCGGVGSAIAAALASEGIRQLGLFDINSKMQDALVDRLSAAHPEIEIRATKPDPRGYDLVINATPLGMKDDDPLPFDLDALSSHMMVADVVLSQTMTPLLVAAAARGCAIQTGLDMLFCQIPSYLEFFGYTAANPDALRAATPPEAFV